MKAPHISCLYPGIQLFLSRLTIAGKINSHYSFASNCVRFTETQVIQLLVSKIS